MNAPSPLGRFDWLKSQPGHVGARRYAILRVGKIKTKAHLAAALGHNFRERETLNADPDRLDQNSVLRGASDGAGVLAAWEARAPEKVRKNAVHALEYFVGGSPEKIHAMSRAEQDGYFERAVQWFEARHGAENILSAVVHRDETTPHLQVLVIPLDNRGKLNARELVGGKDRLRQMQTDFAADVGMSFGLERGRERSLARHQTIKEYYARASHTLEGDFRLPEREAGGFMGRGRETDAEWHERASAAVSEHVGQLTARITERVAERENNFSLRVSASVRESLQTLQDQLQTAQEMQDRTEKLSEWVSQSVTYSLSLNESPMASPDLIRIQRDMASTYNGLSHQLTPAQCDAVEVAYQHGGLTVFAVEGQPGFATAQADGHKLEQSFMPVVTKATLQAALDKIQAEERPPSPAPRDITRDRSRDRDEGFEL